MIGVSLGLKAQNSSLIYDDKYGNLISIENYNDVSKYLSKEFFKQNLTGEKIGYNIDLAELKFDFNISDFKKVSRNKFEFKVMSHPRTKDIETILKYLGGGQYFKMKIRRNEGRIELKEIKYWYSII